MSAWTWARATSRCELRRFGGGRVANVWNYDDTGIRWALGTERAGWWHCVTRGKARTMAEARTRAMRAARRRGWCR